MYRQREYDLDEILDKCCKHGWVLWIFNRSRHKDGKPAFRAECTDCANAIDWQSSRTDVMTTWNRQQRNN